MRIVQLLAQIDVAPLPKAAPSQASLSNILSVVFAITASLAVLMIVIGGFRYIVSHGDPNGVSQAKKAILYSLIGLAVSLAAFSIVRFVIRGVA
jgi:hypothetical protein